MLPPHAPRATGDELPVQGESLTVVDPRLPTIVLVDDEPDILTILHRLLRNMVSPSAVVAVASGQEALELIGLYTVPLLITDYNMAGIDGLQLAQTVKAASPSTRIVLISAYNSPELRRRAQASMVDDYVPKPFTLERIEQIVREALA